MLQKMEGIVIRARDYGEANKIITIMTPDAGKISVMARGAKKTKSRLSSLTELFTHGNYLFFINNPRSMGSLSQGEIINSFRHLRTDLKKTAYAAYFAELLDRLTEDGERNPYLFNLLLLIFRYLEEDKDAEILARLFELKLLAVGGYQPQLHHCTRCALEEGAFTFSVREGGFLCQHCQHTDPHALPLSVSSIRLLRLLFHIQPERLGKINVKEETKEELCQALWLFMDHHTPLRLKSRSFLEQMDRLL